MEALGGAGSVIAIFNQLEGCIRGLRRLYKNFKFAKQEVQQLMDEVQACQILSEIFNEVSRPLSGRVIKLACKKNLDKVLQSQATSAREQIGRITTKLKPLMKGGSPSRLDEILAKVRWHYTKKEGQALLVTLGTVKHTLTFLAGLLTLENSLTRLSQQSTARRGDDLLLSQINHLKKMVQRQTKSLKKLADRMSHMDNSVDESKRMSNTRSMVAVIQEIQKEPVAKAREVITRNQRDHSRVTTPTQRVHDPMRMRRPTVAVVGNTQSRSASRFPNAMAPPDSQDVPYQADENISSERQRTRQGVTQDYGDGNREHYERGSSSSPTQDNNHNHTLFFPMPPFTAMDWQMRNHKKGSSGEDD